MSMVACAAHVNRAAAGVMLTTGLAKGAAQRRRGERGWIASIPAGRYKNAACMRSLTTNHEEDDE
jgi:hypothetical protein